MTQAGTETTRTALQSFKNIDEPLANLTELRKLTQPKPSETQKTVSGLEQVKIEMEAIGKAGKNGKIEVELLDKAIRDKLDTTSTRSRFTEVVRVKLEINLKLPKEQANVFAENLDTIIATLSAYEEMRSSMAAMKSQNKEN